jgi:hypothetical protein
MKKKNEYTLTLYSKQTVYVCVRVFVFNEILCVCLFFFKKQKKRIFHLHFSLHSIITQLGKKEEKTYWKNTLFECLCVNLFPIKTTKQIAFVPATEIQQRKQQKVNVNGFTSSYPILALKSNCIVIIIMNCLAERPILFCFLFIFVCFRRNQTLCTTTPPPPPPPLYRWWQ